MILNSQYSGAAASVRAGSKRVPNMKQQYIKALNDYYTRIVFNIGLPLIESIRPNQKASLTMSQLYIRAMKLWAKTQAEVMATGISETIKKLILNYIVRGLEAGTSEQELAKGLVSLDRRNINLRRAKRIARTETTKAVNHATNEAVRSTGVNFEREWSSLSDARVRNSHLKADGQRRSMKAKFNVGGESLMYPGDPSGSPENIINCRCILLYHPLRREI